MVTILFFLMFCQLIKLFLAGLCSGFRSALCSADGSLEGICSVAAGMHHAGFADSLHHFVLRIRTTTCTCICPVHEHTFPVSVFFLQAKVLFDWHMDRLANAFGDRHAVLVPNPNDLLSHIGVPCFILLRVIFLLYSQLCPSLQ